MSENRIVMTKKYIDADKLKAHIQRLIKKDNYELFDVPELLSVIDSLQQEQLNVDLEKEIDKCWQNWLSPSNQKEVEGVLPKTEFTMYARHFSEFGRKQVLQEIYDGKTKPVDKITAAWLDDKEEEK